MQIEIKKDKFGYRDGDINGKKERGREREILVDIFLIFYLFKYLMIILCELRII